MHHRTRQRLAALAAAATAALTLAPVAGAAPIQEDDPGWNCTVHGDQVCGPHNSNGVAPGLYTNGVLFQTWPTVKTCRNIGGELYCDEAFVTPSLVDFTAPYPVSAKAVS